MKKFKTVLIIEDDPDISMLMKIHFGKSFETVITAENLSDARMKMEEMEDDCFITLDINLPDGCGLDLLKEMRAAGKLQKCVVCSAYSDKEEEAMSFGANGFIAKPIQFSYLDQVVHGLLT